MSDTNDVAMEVQELVWALVDEQATPEQAKRLESLLLEDDSARHIYALCMQMHADLHFLLSNQKTPETNKRTTIKAKGTRAALPVVDMPANQPFTSAFAP